MIAGGARRWGAGVYYSLINHMEYTVRHRKLYRFEQALGPIVGIYVDSTLAAAYVCHSVLAYQSRVVSSC